MSDDRANRTTTAPPREGYEPFSPPAEAVDVEGDVIETGVISEHMSWWTRSGLSRVFSNLSLSRPSSSPAIEPVANEAVEPKPPVDNSIQEGQILEALRRTPRLSSAVHIGPPIHRPSQGPLPPALALKIAMVEDPTLARRLSQPSVRSPGARPGTFSNAQLCQKIQIMIGFCLCLILTLAWFSRPSCQIEILLSTKMALSHAASHNHATESLIQNSTSSQILRLQSSVHNVSDNQRRCRQRVSTLDAYITTTLAPAFKLALRTGGRTEIQAARSCIATAQGYIGDVSDCLGTSVELYNAARIENYEATQHIQTQKDKLEVGGSSILFVLSSLASIKDLVSSDSRESRVQAMKEFNDSLTTTDAVDLHLYDGRHIIRERVNRFDVFQADLQRHDQMFGLVYPSDQSDTIQPRSAEAGQPLDNATSRKIGDSFLDAVVGLSGDDSVTDRFKACYLGN